MYIVNDADVRKHLTIEGAISAVKCGLFDYDHGKAKNSPRILINSDNGTYRFMAASVEPMGVVGAKQGYWVSEFSGNKDSIMSSELITLYDSKKGNIVALFNSHYINQVRTGAISAISIGYMSNKKSKVAALLGTGLHARTQIKAMLLVRKFELIKVFSRNERKREEFCSQMNEEVDAEITPVNSSREAIIDSDVIVDATTAREPIIDGKYLKEGCHISSISGGVNGARQLDPYTYQRIKTFSVDSKEQAQLDQTGDVMWPIDQGILQLSDVREISEIVSGNVEARRSEADITYFKSCGMALFDIAVAKWILDEISR